MPTRAPYVAYDEEWDGHIIEPSFGAEGSAWMLPVIPVAGAAADYVENALTLYHMGRLPEQDVELAWIGTAATFLKYSLIFLSFPFVALGTLTRLSRCYRVTKPLSHGD